MLLDMNKFEISQEKHPVWAKMSAIMEAFETYPSAEWVWWLDVDAIIMTPHVDLHEYLLNPETLKGHLLQGDQLIANDRVPGVEGRPLKTGEVSPSPSFAWLI